MKTFTCITCGKTYKYRAWMEKHCRKLNHPEYDVAHENFIGGIPLIFHWQKNMEKEIVT